MPKQKGKSSGDKKKKKKENNVLSWREQQRLNAARQKRLRKRSRQGRRDASPPIAANG